MGARQGRRVARDRRQWSLSCDELDLVIQAALDGAGLAWVAEDRVTEHLASGALVRVLDDWSPPFPGFFLSYPTRKQQPAALAAVDRIFRLQGAPTSKTEHGPA